MTGVQTCALPISPLRRRQALFSTLAGDNSPLERPPITVSVTIRQLLPSLDTNPLLRRSSIISVSSAISVAQQKQAKTVSARDLTLSPLRVRHRPDQRKAQRHSSSMAHRYRSHTVRKLLCSLCKVVAGLPVAIPGHCLQHQRGLYRHSTPSYSLHLHSGKIILWHGCRDRCRDTTTKGKV